MEKKKNYQQYRRDYKNVTDSSTKRNVEIKPSEMSSTFDFQKLLKVFLEVCPDFNGQKTLQPITLSQSFAETVIFQYSKELKDIKFKKRDKFWEIRFEKTNDKGKRVINFVIISTYLHATPPLHQPLLLNNHLNLTFKQASLLAVAKYCQLVPLLLADNTKMVLTPLAGAVFTKESIPKLAEALSKHEGKQISVGDVLVSIIASCQTDGYNLPQSCCHIALVALIRTVSDSHKRKSLIIKTIKKYKMHGKEICLDLFKIFEKHARSNFHSSRGNSGQYNKSENDELNNHADAIMKFSSIEASKSKTETTGGIKTKKNDAKKLEASDDDTDDDAEEADDTDDDAEKAEDDDIASYFDKNI